MESLKSKRSAIRTIFTKTANGLKVDLETEPVNRGNVEDKLKRLSELNLELKELDNSILDLVIEVKGDEEAIDKEYEQAEKYRTEFILVDRLANEYLFVAANLNRPSSPSLSINGNKSKTYKLPKIQIQQFDGQLINYLPFWAQFKKIHLDDDIDGADKFQYLLQSVKPGTAARQLVESYPLTSENYPKAVSALEQRFGRKDLLIEVYVRELLKLIIANVRGVGREKIPLSELFTKIEAHLRSLESMGIESDKNAAWLYPMVESCLAEDILRAWQRSPLARDHDEDSKESPETSRLKRLMKFLKNEVEGEQRISLAKSGFRLFDSGLKKERNVKDEVIVPTANDLFSGEKRTVRRNETSCIFCEKSHESRACFSASKIAFSQKQDIIKEKRVCFFCLKAGHRAKQCKTKVFCIICSKRHWAVMCPELGVTPSIEAKESTAEEKNVTLANFCSSDEVYLQTLVVNINVKGKKQAVRALIDTGSQRSYILKATADRSGCKPIDKETLVHSLFGGVTSNKEVHNCYRVNISSLDDNYSCQVKLLDQPRICGFVPSLSPGPWMKEILQKGIHLSDLSMSNRPIEILLGADTVGNIFTGDVQKMESGLVVVRTHLGCVVMGKITASDATRSASTEITSMLIHSHKLEDLWKLETLGITDSFETKSTLELDNAVLDHFHETLSKDKDNRYVVSLPWVSDRGNLSSNREIAERRLISTTNKLSQKNKLESYNAVFEDWLKCGIIEEVSEPKGNVHYLPHRAVFKEGSTTPIRPVFDASCKKKHFPSLNDCLAKGPNLLELIPTMLLNFREKKIGVISDIRKAFLQISVNELDRDVLRFLWWNDAAQKQIKEYRHTRVVFGLTCSPFLLGAVLNHHLGQFEHPNSNIAEKLRSSFYVDNCVTSVDSIEDASAFITTATEMMAQANFDLRGWHQSVLDIHEERTQPLKVLGLLWDKYEDELFCDVQGVSECLGDQPLSRRKMLSITQKVFDPIGFTCPVTLLPKLYLQESWEARVSWDSELPEDIVRKFLKWLKEIPLLSLLKIPRQAFLSDNVEHSLHIFCDASRLSYAAVVYIRCKKNDEVSVQLLMAKSRVAPLKKVSIPRLELLSCCIGARLGKFVKKSANLENVREFYWSDSTTALQWIRKDDSWGIFVRNRVKEIRQLTLAEDWKHIPGNQNPADLPSRGCSVKNLLQSKWWEGPSWLKQEDEFWPKSESVINEEEVAEEKIKSTSTCFSVDEKSDFKESIFCFSSYDKTIRVMSWILRFISNCKTNKDKRSTGELTVSELSAAEKIIIKSVQQEVFGSEDVKKLKSISVFKDEDGVMRVKTKLTDRKDEQDFICPIVLPNKHPLVHCLIRDVHMKMSHAGINILMSKLRQTFWILKARKTIRKVISSCMKCKRHDAKRLESTPVALPENRVRDATVFEVTGVDLTGPVILKDQSKAWIILFTCAVYRAIHLELIMSLSTKSFLLGFRRFVARRGRPKVIYSDNGTNFVGTDNLLKTLDWKAIEVEGTISRIQWCFNPPAAPWWGGFWERMIQMVKRLLRRVLGQSSLTYEELTTVLYDCEAVVNSRPLTYVSEDSGDFVPLTPAMFLGDNTEVGVPDLDNLDEVNLNKRYRRQQELRNALRKRFRSEYLSQLVQRPSKIKHLRDVKVGDVVLIENEGRRRISWPMARIIAVYPGRDGHIRVVRLKTPSGEMVRPIQRIFPLEISCPVEDSGTGDEAEFPEVNPLVPGSSAAPRVVTRSGRTVKIPSRFFD